MTRRSDDFQVIVLTSPDEILAGRRLHAQRYLESGFVDELSATGVIEDQWVACSTYLGAVTSSGDVIGVSRLIPLTEEFGLPVLAGIELSAGQREWIESLDPDTVSEFSALAVAKETRLLQRGRVSKAMYRAMLQYAATVLEHDTWLAVMDERVMRILMRTHDFIFEGIGPVQDYLGSPSVPVALDLIGQLRHFALTAPEKNDYFLAGLELDLTGERGRLVRVTGEYVPTTRVSEPLRRS